jgi:acyl-CoA hydrolase
MAKEMTAAEAAALIRPVDRVSSGLGAAWPAQFMAELGKREDWENLEVDGALITVGTELFNREGVRYRCGFFGPLERYLAGTGARIEYLPADFRRFGPLLAEVRPRVMCASAAPPDEGGWCSLSLHAGGTIKQLQAAGADPERLLIVEVNEGYPRTFGIGEHRHALHVDEIDVLVQGETPPTGIPQREFGETAAQIAGHAVKHIASGSTLQTGIGAIPEAIAQQLATGSEGDFGVHTEMFTDGLMQLQQSGKVTNQKGSNDGISVCTFALGSSDLYAWLHENKEVAFLPVEEINAPHRMNMNRQMVTVNGALAIDLYGQVMADTLDGTQFSGVGGGEDFVSGPAYAEGGNSLLCFASSVEREGKRVSRILPKLPPEALVTTPRHQLDIVVTEHGSVDLALLTVAERAEALVSIAHPELRDELAAAARQIA